jgi:hypothetical protein
MSFRCAMPASKESDQQPGWGEPPVLASRFQTGTSIVPGASQLHGNFQEHIMADEKRKPVEQKIQGAGGEPTDVTGPRRAQTNMGVGESRTGEIGTKVVGSEGTGDTIEMRDAGAGAGSGALTGNRSGSLGFETGTVGSSGGGEVISSSGGIGGNTANTIREDDRRHRKSDKDRNAA